jgi:hypothetical protein
MMIMVWLLWSTAHTRTEGPIQVLTALSRQLVGQKERLKCCYWLMMTHTTARKAPHDHLHPPMTRPDTIRPPNTVDRYCR